MKKQQDHILWTLESKNIDFLPVDIGDPSKAKQREILFEKVTERPRPPQIFNDEEYIGVCEIALNCLNVKMGGGGA